MMIKIARLAASCLLILSPAAFTSAADAVKSEPPAIVIERAPESAPSPSQDELTALRTENQRLSKELTRARETLERLQADAVATAAAKGKESAANENKVWESAELKTKIAQLEESVANQTAANATLKKKLDSADASIESLTNKNHQLDTYLSARAAALRDAETAAAAADKRIAELSAAKTADDSKSAALVAEKVRADEATTRLNTILAGVETLQTAKNTLETQLAETRKNEATLREQLTAASTATAGAAAAVPTPPSPDLTAKLAESEGKLAASLRSYSLLEAENQLLKTASADNARLTAELQTLRQEKVAHDTQTPEQAAKIADLEGKLATTLHSFTLLQTENEQLKKSSEQQTQQTAELNRLRQENTDLEARLAAPAPVVAAAAPAPAASSDAESKLATVLRSYSQLQSENDRLKAEATTAVDNAHSAAAKSSSESAAQISAMFNELRQTKSSLTALSTENADLKTRLALAGGPPGTALSSPSRPGSAAATLAAAAPAPVPVVPLPTATERKHLVVSGDTLGKIARRYYGSSARWEEILRANGDVIKDANVLPLGATLRIP
jgi:chromosome segregation ATPase/phage tail protein X